MNTIANHKRIRPVRVFLSLLIMAGILASVVRFIILNPRPVYADSTFSLNEGYGNSINDTNAAVSAGTISGATWKSDDLCRRDKCLYFDGSSDKVTFSDDADLDFSATNTFTITGWFRHPTIATNPDYMVVKHQASTAGGYKVYMDSDGDIAFGIDDDGTWGPEDVVGDDQSKNYDDNQWHFFAAVKDGTTGIYLYVDGILIDQDTSLIATGTLANAASFYLGIDADGTANAWDGFLDEIKIIRQAKTALQVATDYLGSGLSTTGSGPVGYWRLDEAGDAIRLDSTANANDLAESATDTIDQVVGRYTNAGDFESADTEYLSIADNATLSLTGSLTLEAWIKPESVSAGTYNIISKWDGANESYRIMQNADEIRLEINASGNYVETVAANLTASSWYHVAGIYNASAATAKLFINGALTATTTTGTIPTSIGDDAGVFHIGAEDSTGGASGYYDGVIDEARVYGYERSAVEIVEDMFSSPPSGAAASFGPDQSFVSHGLAGYWSMDTLGTAGSNGGPTNIDNASDFGTLLVSGRQVVRTSGGTLYAFVNDGGNCEMWKSSDGASWSNTQSSACDTSGAGMTVSAAIDANSDIHVVYGSGTSSVKYRQYDTGSDTWQGSEETPAIGDEVAGLAITIDSSNVPHYVARATTAGVVVYGNRVGGTWNATVTVDSTSVTDFNDITINNDNIPVVAQIDGTVLVAHLGNANNATSFTSSGTIDSTIDTTAGEVGVSVVADGTTGDEWVSYTDSGGTVSLAKHTGSTWTTNWSTITSKTDVGHETSAAFISGNVYVFYKEENSDVAYDYYNGTSWSGETILQTGTFQDVKAKWAYNNDNQQTTQIDYLYSDATDVYWASLSLGTSSNLTDQSGNNLTLTNNGTTTFVGAKYSLGSEHVPASSQYLSNATTNNGIKTVSLWVNPDSATNYFLSLTSAAYITATTGTLSATGFTNPTIYVNGIQSTTIVADTWQLITVTTDTAIDANQFYIGRQGTNYYDGTIDEVRLYTRTISPAEVSRLYLWVPGPVGHWKLDENTGTSAFDTSSRGNTLTLSSASWSFGKFNSGWNGDGGKYLSRSDDADFDVIASENMTISFWFKSDSATNPSGNEYLMDKENGTGYGLYMTTGGLLTYGIDSDGTWTPADTAATSADVYDGSWHHAAAVKTGTAKIELYVDGVLVGTDSTIAATGDLSNTDTLSIGDQDAADDGDEFFGNLDDIKIYRYARTQSHIVEDMNAGHPAPGSPIGSAVAYWKMDEGHGTSANDGSVNANTLTLSTASWTNSGKFGKAFKAFNGLDNVRLSRTTDQDLEFGATEDFTISLWYKSDGSGVPAATEYLVNDGAAAGSAGYAIYTNTSGNICFGIDDDATWEPDVASCTTADFYDAAWHHIAAVRNVTTDTTKIYIDSVEKDSDTDSTTATLDSSPTFYLGDANGTDGTDEFLGDIDEVKVYRLALSADQIKMEYNRGSQTVMGALSTDSSGASSNADIDSYCPPGQGSACTGPIAHWKIDENTGTTANDGSTNANSGTITAGSGGYQAGKFGSSYRFDAASTVINAGSGSSLDNIPAAGMSLNAWIYPVSQGEGSAGVIFAKNVGTTPLAGWLFQFAGTNALTFTVDGVVDLVRTTSNNVITANAWNHVAVSWDGVMTTASSVHIYVNGLEVTYATTTNGSTRVDDGTSTFFIGNDSTSALTFDGKIDDVRIYNSARTSAQIAWDMNRGMPVGWWKLDEGSGTMANDSSGFSNSGTLTNTPTWTTGKRNSAVNFAASNQHITRADDSDFDFDSSIPFSLAMWFKHNTASATETILTKLESAGTDGGYKLKMESDGDITCETDDDDADTTIDDTATTTAATYDDNVWHHVVCVYDTTNTDLLIYIDGQLVASDTSTTTNSLVNDDALFIGIESATGTEDWVGELDDIRIYNYPLTSQQVKIVIGEGALRFGPASGLP